MDEWIKMRGGLVNSPKVIAMSRFLQASKEFRNWMTPGDSGTVNRQVLCDAALRCVVTALLLKVWSVARSNGKFVGDDLVLPYNRVCDIDQMAGAPCVGDAMNDVGWAVDRDGLTLPNFKEFNVPKTNAEKQKEWRDRKRSVTETLPQDGNAALPSVTPRLDKIREDKKNTDKKKIKSADSGSFAANEGLTLDEKEFSSHDNEMLHQEAEIGRNEVSAIEITDKFKRRFFKPATSSPPEIWDLTDDLLYFGSDLGFEPDRVLALVEEFKALDFSPDTVTLWDLKFKRWMQNIQVNEKLGLEKPKPIPIKPPWKTKPLKSLPEEIQFEGEFQDAAEKCGMSKDEARYHFAKFKDYEFRAAKTNWLAVWRNWVRENIERKTQIQPVRNLTASEVTMQNMRKVLAEAEPDEEEKAQ